MLIPRESSLALNLRGEPRLFRPGQPPVMLERHDAALLTMLVLDGPQPRSQVAAVLWPAAPPAQAAASLRTRLYRLRQRAGQELVSDHGPLTLVAGVEHDLHPDAIAADWTDFGLLGALDYSDLDALHERVLSWRDRWAAARTAALERTAEAAEAQGRMGDAVVLAERLLAGNPGSERAHRRCMRLHYLLGDRSQALTAYTRCRTRLKQLLGVGPDEQTRALAELIERSGLPGDRSIWDATQAALAAPPRLVGRQTSWRQMQEAWQRRALVIILGEAGIGKTRLAADFAAAHGARCVVKAHESEFNLPYAFLERCLRTTVTAPASLGTEARRTLARIVADWDGGLPDIEGGPLEPFRLRAALTEAWAPTSPCLVLDDLQWADDASLEALQAWMAYAGPERPQVLMTAREPHAHVGLQAWLTRNDAVAKITLTPLSSAAVSALLRDLRLPGLEADQMADATRTLVRHTGGNPYVLLELLRSDSGAWAGRDSVDAGHLGYDRLIHLLTRRFGQLPQRAQSVLQLAALAGPLATAALVAEVLGRDTHDVLQDWQALQAGQWLPEAGVMPDAVRDAVRRSIDEVSTRRMQARLAVHLERAGAPPAQQVEHWLEAQNWDKAAGHLATMARLAWRQTRPMDAVRLWEQAALCLDRLGGDASTLQSWAARAEAARVAMVTEGTAALARRLNQLLDLAKAPAQRLHALNLLCRAQLNEGRGEDTLVPSAQALALARSLRQRPGELTAIAWHALALALAGRIEEGRELITAHAASARRCPDLRVRLDFFGSLGYVLHLAGHAAKAMRATRRAILAALELGDLGEEMEQTINLSTCLNTLGRIADGVAEGERALELWHRMGDPPSLMAASVLVQLGSHYTSAGRFGEALAVLEGALTHLQQHGPQDWRTLAEHRLASLFVRLGQPARAAKVLTPLAEDAAAGRRCTRALLESRIRPGQPGAAHARLAALLDEAGARMEPHDRHALQLAIAALAEPAEAVASCEALLVECQATGHALSALHARVRLADSCRRMGRRDEAAAHARQALRASRTSACLDMDRATLYALIHQTASECGDVRTADAALALGVDWVRQALGNVPASYRQSFSERNDVREMLAAARNLRSRAARS
jgi:DNA-binding SARP family transcriptional activator/tetratricopeptide (TPR) repeat protein